MRIEKGRIEQGDDVYAALSVSGMTVAELRNVQAVGIDDILVALRRMAARYSGMARVCIRNKTRGWMVQLPVLLCKSVFSLRTRESMVAEGLCDPDGQMRLQFG